MTAVFMRHDTSLSINTYKSIQHCCHISVILLESMNVDSFLLAYLHTILMTTENISVYESNVHAAS